MTDARRLFRENANRLHTAHSITASVIIIMEITKIVKELRKQKQEQTSKEWRKDGD
jgi:hypothetical protein